MSEKLNMLLSAWEKAPDIMLPRAGTYTTGTVAAWIREAIRSGDPAQAAGKAIVDESLITRLSDYFHVNARPENDLAQGYIRELDEIIRSWGSTPAAWIDQAALQAAHEIVALNEKWTYTRKKAAIQVIVAREMMKAASPAPSTTSPAQAWQERIAELERRVLSHELLQARIAAAIGIDVWQGDLADAVASALSSTNVGGGK